MTLAEDLEALERRFEALANDDVMHLVSAMAREVKADMRDRYIAAAKEKDSFFKAVKRPFVSDSELR